MSYLLAAASFATLFGLLGCILVALGLLLALQGVLLGTRRPPARPVDTWLDVPSPGTVRIVVPAPDRRMWMHHHAGDLEVIDRRLNMVLFTPGPHWTQRRDPRVLRAVVSRLWQRGDCSWWRAPTPEQERRVRAMLAA